MDFYANSHFRERSRQILSFTPNNRDKYYILWIFVSNVCNYVVYSRKCVKRENSQSWRRCWNAFAMVGWNLRSSGFHEIVRTTEQNGGNLSAVCSEWKFHIWKLRYRWKVHAQATRSTGCQFRIL